MKWYFALNRWLPLKLLLLSWLVWGLVFNLLYGGMRAVGSARVLWAIPAEASTVFAVLVFLFAAPEVLGLMFTPVIVYRMQIGGIAGAWQGSGSAGHKIKLTLILLVGGYLVALLLAWGGVTVLAWMADVNPCVAWKAGVTGSIRPGPDCVP